MRTCPDQDYGHFHAVWLLFDWSGETPEVNVDATDVTSVSLNCFCSDFELVESLPQVRQFCRKRVKSKGQPYSKKVAIIKKEPN